MAEQTFTDLLKEFAASLPLDRRLYRHDIRGSQAHCRMLARQGIVTNREAERICRGLEEILEEIERGVFLLSIEWEDIHMNVEHRLIEKIGDLGGKLHTARSRNDQVALDERLYMREEIRGIIGQLIARMEGLVEKAGAHLEVVIPGYTHLQRAQPVLLSHHFMAYYEMFRRDKRRMEQCLSTVNELPLGAGALAGIDFPVDPEFVARELGFASVFRNSIDAVSDRDFLLEFLAAASILGIHLSRFCEELVLWSSQEFGFVRLDDLFCTGSSIMPQKRNPDIAELIRGKSGALLGHLVSMLVVMKGLPLSYNKDMQEDKRPMFETVDTVQCCLRIFVEMIRTMAVRTEKMQEATEAGYMTATDLADYLVGKGRPSRKAHGVSREIVTFCMDRGIPLSELELDELRRFDESFEADVFSVLSPNYSANSRTSPGGTASERVREAIENAKEEMAGWKASAKY
jgi:argininosuccinate lyase